MQLKIDTPRVFKPLLYPARYKGAHGGRGSGKSHYFAEALIEYCILHTGTRWACIREVQKSLEQSVKRLLEDKIEKLGVSTMFDIKQFEIGTPGGGIIIFQGMQNHTAESIKSLEGFDGAWVEEAQSLSQRSLDLLRPTIRKPGSELWFSWNPNSADDPIDLLLRGEHPPPDSVVIQSNFDDNPWFPDVLKAEMEYDRTRDKEKYNHVWLGEYRTQSHAQVFKNWQVQEFPSDPNASYRLGADWGFANDPSVLVRCYIDGRRLYVDYEAWMIGCEIDMLPDLFDRVPDSRKYFITADTARPETISYMQRHGYPRINAAAKGKGSIEDGVEFLKSFDIIVHPRCKNVIDELAKYSYKVDPLTEQVLPLLDDKYNHTIDALRYAMEGARKAGANRKPKEPAYQSGGWMG
jgi:phage terminase large subunit